MQSPPPPSITPRQMNLLRIVVSMAWADGHLAEEEKELMLDRFTHIFATDVQHQQLIQQELQGYLIQNIPLEELIPHLQTDAEKELVLMLGYEVIAVSSRTPEEDKINQEEAKAYQKLVQLLNLPPELVKQIETQLASEQRSQSGMIDKLVNKLGQFVKSQHKNN